MRIALLVEGKTERVFLPVLRSFLITRLTGKMPRLDPEPYDGRIPKGEKLRRVVERLLNSGDRSADRVIALTDVYTGQRDFKDATEAKRKMTEWVGNDTRFHAHAAQYEFEAWLLPFWNDIQRLAGSNRNSPAVNPETVNHDQPPSRRLQEVFRSGTKGRRYVKPRDAATILKDKDLEVAARACPELKALLNTILGLCGGELIG